LSPCAACRHGVSGVSKSSRGACARRPTICGSCRSYGITFPAALCGCLKN
jgi:hypothetical protein